MKVRQIVREIRLQHGWSVGREWVGLDYVLKAREYYVGEEKEVSDEEYSHRYNH